MPETDTMTCAYCGRTKRWPADFISTLYAECKECWEKRPTHTGILDWIKRLFRPTD